MENTNIKKSYLWNAIGSCANAASTIVFTLITTRMLGAFYSGIFTISIALAQQMLTVSSFETGTYYVTERKDIIDLGTHLSIKLILLFLAIFIGAFVSLFKYSFSYKALCVILVCCFKSFDGLSALFFAFLQKKEHLYIAGKSLSFRMIIVMLVLLITQILCKVLSIKASISFMISLVAILIASLAWIFTYELSKVRECEKLYFTWNFRKISNLFFECLPLFIGSFILTYICNQPKYVIDGLFSEEVQNAFGIIFIPSSVICMLSFFIYKPLLTTLTKDFKDNNIKSFISRVLKISFLIIILDIICVIGAYFLGIPVLSLVYNCSLSGYKSALCIGIFGGGFYAFAMLLYNVITIMRKQRIMLAAYIISYLLSLAITKPMVKSFGVSGASMSYLFVNLLLTLLLSLIVVFNIKKTVQKD